MEGGDDCAAPQRGCGWELKYRKYEYKIVDVHVVGGDKERRAKRMLAMFVAATTTVRWPYSRHRFVCSSPVVVVAAVIRARKDGMS